MKIRHSLFLMMILALCLGGCHHKLPEEKSASELAADGQKMFEERDYKSAITSYQRLRDWYPFSDLVATAELKIADANYKLRQYDEAAAAYEDFANLHPRNPSTPYALYQAGRCFFDQMSTFDRDQTFARKALDGFTRFVDRYPNNDYADAARAHILDCQRSLASNELLVAEYYFKRKNYKAALIRFRNVLDNYPDVGVQYIALQYLAKCETLASKTTLEKPREVETTQTK